MILCLYKWKMIGFIAQLYEAEMKHLPYKMILQANDKKHEARIGILAIASK